MKNAHPFISDHKLHPSGVWMILMCIFIAILVITSRYFLTLVVVSGDSMYPTMRNGTMCLVDRRHSDVRRGDVIVAMTTSADTGQEYIVKRILAIGGDEITINYADDILLINGVVWPEPYINKEEPDPMQERGGQSTVHYTIPDGFIFVMGDNRNHSTDSRDEGIGFVPIEHIVGKVIYPQATNERSTK